MHELLIVVWKTPSDTTVFEKAVVQVPQPKLGKGVCSAVGRGRVPASGVVSVRPAIGTDVVST